MDLNQLKTDAGHIRDASAANENTAFRVGSWLVSLIEWLTNTSVEAVITSISKETTADGIVLTINHQKADGETFASTFTLPLADATTPGLLSPEMLEKLSSASTGVNGLKSANILMGQRVSTLENTLDELSNKTAEFTTHIQTSDNSFTGLHRELSQMYDFLNRVDNAQDNVNARISAAEKSVSDITTVVTTHIQDSDNYFTNVNNRVDSLTEVASTLESNQERDYTDLNDRLTVVENAGNTPETYVLNFTIADGTNTGAFEESNYRSLREAIEAGKLIVIAGGATRATATSQAMDSDYVVIRYSTPRIGSDNKSITISFYELKFSADQYSTKAIHKTLT